MSEKKPGATVSITFSLPDVITVGCWDAYCAGRQDYFREHAKGSQLMADYGGALEVIRQGFVKVDTASDKLRAYLDTSANGSTPIAFVGLVVREVANKIDASVSGPLGEI